MGDRHRDPLRMGPRNTICMTYAQETPKGTARHWFLRVKLSNVNTDCAEAGDGVRMSTGFLQGVAFFALVVVVVTATFGGFGVL